MNLYRWLPLENVKIVLVFSLSFLIGLEREEHKVSTGFYSFGGVRTFPLIGLIGYALALLSGGQLLPVALGFAVVGGFLMLSSGVNCAVRVSPASLPLASDRAPDTPAHAGRAEIGAYCRSKTRWMALP